jgi:hypothetical protein
MNDLELSRELGLDALTEIFEAASEFASVRAEQGGGPDHWTHVHVSAWERLPGVLGRVRPSIREERRQVSLIHQNHVIGLEPVPMAGEVVWYKAICSCGKYQSRVVNYQKAANLGTLHIVHVKKEALGVGR